MNTYKIQLQLDINTSTGIPYYGCIVPEQYRKWLSGYACDSIFDKLLTIDGYILTIAEAYEKYPPYEEMVEFDNWSKENHEEFREALGWFSKDNYILVA